MNTNPEELEKGIRGMSEVLILGAASCDPDLRVLLLQAVVHQLGAMAEIQVSILKREKGMA